MELVDRDVVTMDASHLGIPGGIEISHAANANEVHIMSKPKL
jgi:hypothetical protein